MMESAIQGDVEEAAGIAAFGALIAHPTRVLMLSALLGGNKLSAGVLARLTAVSPQTASEHLARLVAGGLLIAESHGRQRFFRIANPEVAGAVEALGASLAQPDTRAGSRRHALRVARTCYDHLAGRLGVEVTEALLRVGALSPSAEGYTVTETGILLFSRLSVDVAKANAARRRFAPACLDWTERRSHLAGALGSALCSRFIEARWVAPLPGGRALRITAEGEATLGRVLRIHPEQLVVSAPTMPVTARPGRTP